MTQVAVLKVKRGTQDDSRFVSYEVPFQPSESLLDGLRWIRQHVDPSLAVRFSCINANACKECMVEADGEVVYACTTRLKTGETTVEPLGNKDLIRDLITQIAPTKERL